MTDIYVLHALQFNISGMAKGGKHHAITWDPHPGVFTTKEEAEFYCEEHSKNGLVFWYTISEVGSFTKSHMKKHRKARKR